MNRKNNHFILVLSAMVSLCAASAFAAAPTVSAFAPASGVLYSAVTITGTNFISPMTVSFNGVASTSVIVINSTTARATLPPTASTGVITVGTSGGSANSASSFTVLPGVLVSPAVGPPTSVTRIYYSGFSAYEPIDFYLDTGDIALASASATGAGNPPVTIPATARPGVHFVTAVGRRSLNSAQANFTVQTNWPQYDFASNLKGKNRYENVLSPATVGDLEEAWRTPKFIAMNCAPAVVNGIVYADFYDGTIRAFNETTGAQKWSYPTGGTNMYSSPAVANGIVYAGSTDSYLYALDAVTGTLKWSYPTGNLVESSPNVVNGIVYFGSLDDYVYALNSTTGAVIWRFATGGAVYSSPMVANGVVYVGSSDKSLYALNATTGAKFWAYGTGGSIEGSAVFAGGFVCIGSTDGNMYGLYTPSGTLAWTFSTNGSAPISSSAAAVGGALFFGDSKGMVYSISSDGSVLWSTFLPGTRGSTVQSPVCVANGVVYATNSYFIDALDQSTGALLTRLPAGSTLGGPAVVNGAVFIGDDNIGMLARYTPNALLSNYVAPRPDPMQLRPHRLR